MDTNPKTLLELLEIGERTLWGRTTTHKTNPAAVRRIAEIIGVDRPLTSLKTADFDKVAEELEQLGLAPGTINRNLSAAARLLSWGKDRGWGPKDPIAYDWQAEPDQTMRLVHDGEDDTIIGLVAGYDEMGKEVADFMRASLWVGTRRIELLSRQPEHLKFEDGRWWLQVKTAKRKALKKRGGGKPSTPPERFIPLTDDIAEVLKARLPWTIKPHNIRYRLEWAREQMGFKAGGRMCLHAFRHTFGTRTVRVSANPFVTKDLMGHADIKTTQRYVHVGNQMMADVMDRMGGKFNASTTPKGELHDSGTAARDARGAG